MNNRYTTAIVLLAGIIIPVVLAQTALAKSSVAGGYSTGFECGIQEAQAHPGEKPSSCPLANKHDDYCKGWKDGFKAEDED